LPAQLESADYPGLIPEGQTIQTIAVPSLLAVYDWRQDGDRYTRISRLVDYLFDRFSKLQTEPGYHPKWKEINLAAVVPGWKRFPAMEAKLVAAGLGADKDKKSTVDTQPKRSAQGDKAGKR